jgi:4-amino-4-deoxy-L-arabinose transferase-like glycosyltransferase
MLPLAGWFAYRLGGPRTALGVLALVACSPMQIYVARHALIDGFFGFWAIVCVWLLWENLQKPAHRGWLAAYTAALTLTVLTKENAFFVFVAILGIFAVNRWAKFGTVSRPLVICTFVGGLLGTGVIAFISGGLDYAFETYLILVRNASHLEYAIRTGDGPWYRYISDLLLMSPLVLLLAVGAIFHLNREKKTQLYLLSFIAFSYLVMCNVKYGMNLRYANMWDMPLRFLAFSQLAAMCARFGKRGPFILTLCVVALCAIDLRQYDIFFVKHELYELIPLDLGRSLLMIK